MMIYLGPRKGARETAPLTRRSCLPRQAIVFLDAAGTMFAALSCGLAGRPKPKPAAHLAALVTREASTAISPRAAAAPRETDAFSAAVLDRCARFLRPLGAPSRTGVPASPLVCHVGVCYPSKAEPRVVFFRNRLAAIEKRVAAVEDDLGAARAWRAQVAAHSRAASLQAGGSRGWQPPPLLEAPGPSHGDHYGRPSREDTFWSDAPSLDSWNGEEAAAASA